MRGEVKRILYPPGDPGTAELETRNETLTYAERWAFAEWAASEE